MSAKSKFLSVFGAIFLLGTSLFGVDRVYEGNLNGTANLFGVPVEQSINVRAFVSGEPSNGVIKVSGQFLEKHPLIKKTNVSDSISIKITTNPARLSISTDNFKGKAAFTWSKDLKRIALVAKGTVHGIELTINSAILTQIAESASSTAPPTPSARFDSQLAFVGIQYYWPELSDSQVEEFVKNCAKYGVNPSCEIMALVTTGDIDAQGESQIRKLKPWVEYSRKYGRILKLSNNSNDKLNPTAKQDTFIKRTSLLLSLYGPQNILYQPMSEDDSKLNAQIAEATRVDAENRWPKSQLINMTEHRKSGAFIESHTGTFNLNIGSGWNRLYVNDSGSGRSDQLSAQEQIALGTSFLKAGCSWENYGFIKEVDWKVAEAFGATIKSSTTVEFSLDAINISGHKNGYKGRSGAGISQLPITKPAFTAKIMNGKVYMFGANRSGWPIIRGDSVVDGKVFIFWVEEDGKVFGDMFEWLKVGQSMKELHNIFGGTKKLPDGTIKRVDGILKDSNGVVHIPPKGTTIYLCQVSVDVKQRSPVIKADGVW